MERQKSKTPVDPKSVRSLRIFVETGCIKPQWLNRFGNWKNFKENGKTVKENIYPARFHGHELVHLSNRHAERARKKIESWLIEWKNNHAPRIEIERMKIAGTQTIREKKKKKEKTKCGECGRRISMLSIPKQKVCLRCRDRKDHEKRLEELRQEQ